MQPAAGKAGQAASGNPLERHPSGRHITIATPLDAPTFLSRVARDRPSDAE